MRTKIITAVLVLMLAGCTVGPDYVRPKIAAADHYHAVADKPASPESNQPFAADPRDGSYNFANLSLLRAAG